MKYFQISTLIIVLSCLLLLGNNGTSPVDDNRNHLISNINHDDWLLVSYEDCNNDLCRIETSISDWRLHNARPQFKYAVENRGLEEATKRMVTQKDSLMLEFFSKGDNFPWRGRACWLSEKGARINDINDWIKQNSIRASASTYSCELYQANGIEIVFSDANSLIQFHWMINQPKTRMKWYFNDDF